MLDNNIFASFSEAAVNYDFPKVYKLVQHDISLTCKYQGPHSLVKLPPFSKRILLTFNDHGSHVIPKVGMANYPVLHI